MKALLQQAIKINRQLVQEATEHVFKIACSQEEEEAILKESKETDFTTILRLYERDSH